MRRSVYTRGFPASFTKDQLTEVFKPYGKIKRVKYISEDTKLFAVVRFFSEEDAEKAINELHEKNVHGVQWYVNYCERVNDRLKKQRLLSQRQNTIILRDFPETFTEHAARTIFDKYGNIKNLQIRLPYCFITFDGLDNALEAVQSEKNLVFEGKRVFVALQKDRERLVRRIRDKKMIKELKKTGKYNPSYQNLFNRFGYLFNQWDNQLDEENQPYPSEEFEWN